MEQGLEPEAGGVCKPHFCCWGRFFCPTAEPFPLLCICPARITSDTERERYLFVPAFEDKCLVSRLPLSPLFTACCVSNARSRCRVPSVPALGLCGRAVPPRGGPRGSGKAGLAPGRRSRCTVRHGLRAVGAAGAAVRGGGGGGPPALQCEPGQPCRAALAARAAALRARLPARRCPPDHRVRAAGTGGDGSAAGPATSRSPLTPPCVLQREGARMGSPGHPAHSRTAGGVHAAALRGRDCGDVQSAGSGSRGWTPAELRLRIHRVSVGYLHGVLQVWGASVQRRRHVGVTCAVPSETAGSVQPAGPVPFRQTEC